MKSEIPDISDILKPDTELHQYEFGDPKEIDKWDIEFNQEMKNFIEYGNKVGWDKIYKECGYEN